MICIAANSGGKGGVAGGAGASGQASQQADGSGANSYGYPVLEAVTGMTVSYSIQLTDDYNGEVPSDLTNITSVHFVAAPTMNGNVERRIEKNCTFTPDGVVTLELTPTELNYNNGVWFAEFLCSDAEGKLVKNYRAYLCIRKGTTGSNDKPNTITVMDVRLALMDTSAEANQLIDDLEFSDVMILSAVQRCIDEWNETPPETSAKFDATTFPYREHLIKGVIGYLMQMIAYRYTRNRMQYSASGLNLDSSDKGPQYVQLAQVSRQEWKNFLTAKKTELNMQECFGTVDLPYFG